jgi:hypothetical protein
LPLSQFLAYRIRAVGTKIDSIPGQFSWERGMVMRLIARSKSLIITFAGMVLTFFVLSGVCQLLSAQSTAPPEVTAPRPSLTVDEIVNGLVQNNLDRARALGSYEGTRVYRLNYQGFPGSKSAEMVVDVKYQSPDTKDFTIRSQQGSKLILDKVFKRMLQSEKEALAPENQSRVALNKENYSFNLVGTETIASGPAYILSVDPKNDNKLLYRGKIWVNAEEFAVVRIEASPAKNPSFWTKESRIEQTYSKIGDFWLPLSNRSSSSIRLGGHALLTIDYQDYKITAADRASTPAAHSPQ